MLIRVLVLSMVGHTVESLQRQYGQELAAEPYMDITTCRKLRRALEEQQPQVMATDAVCTSWLQLYRTPAGAVRITSVSKLEEEYGRVVREEVASVRSSEHKLCGALRARRPSLLIIGKVVRNWLDKFGDQCALKPVHVAGHLELWYGDRIRAEAPGMTAGVLKEWLGRVLAYQPM